MSLSLQQIGQLSVSIIPRSYHQFLLLSIRSVTAVCQTPSEGWPQRKSISAKLDRFDCCRAQWKADYKGRLTRDLPETSRRRGRQVWRHIHQNQRPFLSPPMKSDQKRSGFFSPTLQWLEEKKSTFTFANESWCYDSWSYKALFEVQHWLFVQDRDQGANVFHVSLWGSY